MLWVCYIIVYRRYCCIGLEHHGVGLFCDRWQKSRGPEEWIFGALHSLYESEYVEEKRDMARYFTLL